MSSFEVNEEIILRKTVISECDALFALFSDDDNVRYTNFQKFNDTSSLLNFLDRFLKIEMGQPLQYGPYSIYLNNSFIGLCGAQQKDLSRGVSELWYVLHKNYWGKGLTKKAVELLMHECKSNKQLKSIYAEAVSVNTASWHILEKLGFMKTAELKNGFKKDEILEDLYCYSCQNTE